MRSVICLVMVLGLGVVGCGNNECEDALDKLEECDVDLGDAEPTEDEASECSSQDECGAKCINDASCSEIESFLSTGMGDVATCLAAC